MFYMIGPRRVENEEIEKLFWVIFVMKPPSVLAIFLEKKQKNTF